MLYEILYYLDEKKYYIMGILVVLLLFFIGLFCVMKEKRTETDSIIVEKRNGEEENVAMNVDIKGAVNKPGVYTIGQDKIVLDVVKKAGGFTKNADTNYINLSKRIKDEMVILIYTKEEIQKMKEGEGSAVIVEGNCHCPEIKNDGCLDFENVITNEEVKKPSGKINLNTATLKELITLSGIGSSKADAIIRYRNEHGKFQTIEEVKKVKGIGDAVYEKIKDQITIS